jgi:hypothetical protein
MYAKYFVALAVAASSGESFESSSRLQGWSWQVRLGGRLRCTKSVLCRISSDAAVPFARPCCSSHAPSSRSLARNWPADTHPLTLSQSSPRPSTLPHPWSSASRPRSRESRPLPLAGIPIADDIEYADHFLYSCSRLPGLAVLLPTWSFRDLTRRTIVQ